MKPAAFDYARPATLAEALDLWQGAGGEAQYLAGGQSLLPAVAMRLNQPALLIDLGGLAELRGIGLDGDGLRIGAMTRHAEALESPLVQDRLPLLAQALTHVAHPAIRNRGTIGGSLSLNDPAAELPACALALDAVLHLAGPGGPRAVAAGEFFQGIYQTALDPGDILISVAFPGQTAPHHFAEVARRHGDFALAGLAAVGGADPRLVWFGLTDGACRDAGAEAALAAGQGRAAVMAAALGGIDIAGDTVTPAAARATMARTLLSRMLDAWGLA